MSEASVSWDQEEFLLEGIEVEAGDVVRSFLQKGKIDLEDRDTLLSMILLVHYSKVLSLSFKKKRSKVVVRAIKILLNLINDNQGYNSKRLKEIVVEMNNQGPIEQLTHGTLEQLMESGGKFRELVNEVVNDYERLTQENPAIESKMQYTLIRLYGYLNKDYQYVRHGRAYEMTDIREIDRLFNRRRILFKSAAELSMRALFLREVPLLLIALMSLFSFFLGIQWDRNFLTIKRIGKAKEVGTDPSKLLSGAELQFYCNEDCFDSFSGEKIYEHSFQLCFNSLQNENLEDSKVRIEVQDESAKNLFGLRIPKLEEKRPPRLFFVSGILSKGDTSCFRAVNLQIASLERGRDDVIKVFSTSKEPPIVSKIRVAPNTHVKYRSNLFVLIIYAINAFSGWIFLGLAVVFLAYLFSYASRRH